MTSLKLRASLRCYGWHQCSCTSFLAMIMVIGCWQDHQEHNTDATNHGIMTFCLCPTQNNNSNVIAMHI